MTATDNATVARDCVQSGTPPILLICSAKSESLSNASRELVRDLRTDGARVEFHAPGDADALLQAANRLLAEIPLEALLGSTHYYPPHLLIIDDAESLSMAEATALRRLVQGLRGSAFRIMLLVRQSQSGLQRLPLSEITDIALIWAVDGLEEIEPVTSFVVESSPKIEEAPTVTAEPIAVKAMPPARQASDPIPDVLAELARERGETRGFDIALPRRWMTTPVKVAFAVLAFIVAGYGVTTLFTGTPVNAPVVYDCGLHPDRESVDVLLTRIGRTTPTRVTTESGRFRLQVGPFASHSAAEAARTQVWRLGACRVEATVVRAAAAPTRKVGG